MRQLTDTEVLACSNAFTELLNLDDSEVIFEAGFIAGLEYHDKRIEELEAQKAEFEKNTRIEFLEGQLQKLLHPSLTARYRQELSQLKKVTK